MKKIIYLFYFIICFFLLFYDAHGNSFLFTLELEKTSEDSLYHEEHISICRYELPYFYANKLYYSEGTYEICYKTIDNKDSLVILYLTVLDVPTKPSDIIGDSLINGIGSYVYRIEKVKDAEEYTWYISNLEWITNKSKSDSIKLFIPTEGIGILSVVAINRCGISRANQLSIQSNLSIKDNISLNEILIYPIPFNDAINIQLPSSEKHTISIYDMDGKLVYKTFSNNTMKKIEITNFNSGIYILKVGNSNNKNIITHKTLKL